MGRKDGDSDDPLVSTVEDDQRDKVGYAFLSTPDEGRRLISAFLRIREAALRKAITDFVEEMSTLHDEGH